MRLHVYLCICVYILCTNVRLSTLHTVCYVRTHIRVYARAYVCACVNASPSTSGNVPVSAVSLALCIIFEFAG